MMDSSTKKMVVRLIEETSTRRLRWQIKDAPNPVTVGSDDVIPLYFECDFKSQNLCVYKVRVKKYIDGRDHYWNESLVIGILDHESRLVWMYEGNDSELSELFSDVRRSVSNVDQFLSYFR
ncbi:hypothetical protein [Pseudomonas frederiksbergensis]|uniref:hypothetical protein n=1 Tax=Pseudomonas frederiksbergensis TaxID=104087 RepID=UPI00101AEC7F|nr:hypothetical protein [Pseudomonas frederiksbergensis]